MKKRMGKKRRVVVEGGERTLQRKRGNINGRRGPWSCEGSMPQYRGMPGPGMGVGGLGSKGRWERIGDFQRGN